MKKIIPIAALALLCLVGCNKKNNSDAADASAQPVKTLAQVNEEYGKAFLDSNGRRQGVVTTPSGLQYEVLTEGKGDKPAATDTVTVHYTGTLLDGSVFDSSVERGEPATFPLSAVIPGWTEGVQLMSKGAKYRFYIPSDLAYGMQGTPGGPIGPNATLIFDVELLEINGK